MITLEDEDKLISTIDIDLAVCAEIPNQETHPELYEYVTRHMMHGPCGSVCIRDGKCSKNFPKSFNDSTKVILNTEDVTMELVSM